MKFKTVREVLINFLFGFREDTVGYVRLRDGIEFTRIDLMTNELLLVFRLQFLAVMLFVRFYLKVFLVLYPRLLVYSFSLFKRIRELCGVIAKETEESEAIAELRERIKYAHRIIFYGTKLIPDNQAVFVGFGVPFLVLLLLDALYATFSLYALPRLEVPPSFFIVLVLIFGISIRFNSSHPDIKEYQDAARIEESEAVADLRERIEDAPRIGDGTELTRADQVLWAAVGVLLHVLFLVLLLLGTLIVFFNLYALSLPLAGFSFCLVGLVLTKEEKEEEEEKEEIELAAVEREVVGKEEIVERGPEIAELSDLFTTSDLFTMSYAEDSSSSTTVSPNGRVRPDISSGKKGASLGRGSFGSVFEAIDP
jgi:hypothetical protein